MFFGLLIVLVAVSVLGIVMRSYSERIRDAGNPADGYTIIGEDE